MMGLASVRNALAVSKSYKMAAALAKVQLPEKMQYQAWHRQQQEETKFTPDVRLLEGKLGQLVFFYDQFQEYGALHQDLLNEGVQPLCTAFSADRYQAREKIVGDSTLDRIVAVKPFREVQVLPWCDPPKDVPANVKGELMLVPTELVYYIDNFMENGKVYDRIRTQVRVPFRLRAGSVVGDKRVWFVRAWMYIGRPDYWGPLFDAGYTTKPLPTFEPNHLKWPRYYAYRTGGMKNK